MNIAFTTKKDGKSVLFNNLSVCPSSTKWSWSFGDGSANSNERSPSHEYSGRGFFLVELTAIYGTEDPITISTILVVSDLVKTTLTGSIYTLIYDKLPKPIASELSFNVLQSYIEKWQLFLQPLVNHNISVSNYNDELYYEALENQLILELVIYDYLVNYINNFILTINSGTTVDGEKIVKKITTGPSEVEWETGSDLDIEKLRTITKYSTNGGYLDYLKSTICDLSRRLDINIPLCKQPKHPILPMVVQNQKDRFFEGPNPTTGLN